MSVRLREMIGSVLVGRYRIVAPIGMGGSSGVYLADDTQLGRRVAIKLLHEVYAGDQKFLKRFRAEARSVAALNHPNIMHVYDFGDDSSNPGSVPFLVMEFVGGGSLRAVLDQCDTLTPSQALEVGLFAARGLAYAHGKGLVHRDIKPANILFGEEGRLRVADFGLARALAEASWTEPEGILFGTAKYTSPEQATGQPLTGASDVYSLGLVLIEAVTGDVPFAGETKEASLTARRDRDVEVPAELGELRSLLERVGRCDPEARPDAGELEIALLAAAEDMVRPEPLALPGAIASELLEPGALEGADLSSPERGRSATAVPVSDGRPWVVDEDDATDLTGFAATAKVRSDEDPTEPETDRTDHTGTIDIPLDDDPRRRERRSLAVAAVVGLLLLACAGGFATWWFAIRIPTHVVPDLIGVSKTEGVQRLESLGYEVETTFIRKDGTKVDDIVETDPEAGTSIPEGTTISVVVSRGASLIAMPELAPGTPEEEVLGILEFAQLEVGTRSDPFDEDFPAGALISYEAPISADGQIAKGSPVDLVISAGPQPRAVPANLEGSELEVAAQLLESVQLTYRATYAYSEVKPGVVISANKAAGAEVPRGTAIELTVSQGPEPTPIPDVAGMSGAEAAAVLEAAGFGVSGVDGSPTGTVRETIPAAGDLHQEGTAVKIITDA